MTRALVRLLVSAAAVVILPACGGTGEAPLTVEVPLHLEDHLDRATVEGSERPDPIPATVEWRFDEPQPEWKVVRPVAGGYRAADLTRTDDALRVVLPEGRRNPRGLIVGGLYVDLPDWRREEWAEVLIRARTADPVVNLVLLLNPREGAVPASMDPLPQVFERSGGTTPVVSDGSVQTYRIRPNWSDAPPGPWRRVGLGFQARGPGSIDLLSVSVVPTAAAYAHDRLGLQSVLLADVHRWSLFTHAPSRVSYQVRVPDGGRLDTALGVVGADSPVDFRVVARPGSGEAATLLSETHADPGRWAERSVDLARFAGQTVTLTLETGATRPGTVAFWGSPTLSGTRGADKPNVIFYVIDGGGADYMSVYGYNRRTTPTLERLAAEGAVFERAYSNSAWTKPSTASFMTSLHNSVLGNTHLGPVDPLTPQVATMAERFHAAGYGTAVFTPNPNAGTVSGLERGVDLFQESGFPRADEASSVDLHRAFWRWRDANPGVPYWVHFQTTDVHAVSNNRLVRVGGLTDGPFAGLFVSPADVRTLRDWTARLGRAGGGHMRSDAFQKTGIDRIATYTLFQGLFDQQMAHNDHQLGQLVEQLKAAGDWSNTLLIVAADHGISAALADMPLALLETVPPPGPTPLLADYVSRVPLLVIWPGRVQAGRRFDAAVSMIDVLPTVLDLAGLPPPQVTQGQSLAPLLRGEPGWTPRPVILDEFQIDRRTGRLAGRFEVIDGRWGASMWIGPPQNDPSVRWPFPVMVYDLWNDPGGISPINTERPDLVEKYTRFLEDTWKDHQALAKQFTPGAKSALTPEQLERLRALGYIR